ncbi:MAG: WD40/YVTN/BNR-like repeat-containing protein, partial [Acidobacteriota bacterium]
MVLGLVLGATGAGAADKWTVSFFHDEQDSGLTRGEIVFPSERRGLALGVLNEKGRVRPVVVVTGDGGKRWEMVPLKEIPVTVSCLNDGACWMATEGGVWFTEEAGRSWRKVSRQKGILALHFDSATHGFAGGVKKTIWETQDGGKSWVPIAATRDITAKEEYA